MLKFFRNNNEISIAITTKTFFKVLLLIVVTFLLLGLIRNAAYAFTLITIAFILAVALNAPVTWVASHLPGPLRGNRASATALSFLLVVALIVLFLASFLPPIIRQTASFINDVPVIVQSLHDQNSSVGHFISHYHLQGQLDQLSSELDNRLRGATTTAVAAVMSILSSLVSVLTILVITFMMLIEGPLWLKFFRDLVPADRRSHLDGLLHDMYRAVKGYVNGQVLLALIASFLVLPGLIVFHVSYPVALMAVVFVCGLIPMIGHTIGALIVTAIALFHSPLSALGILIYYILYQQVENYLIQPRLQATTTNLSPLLVILSLVIGVSFGGLLGGLLAIPIVACIRVWAVDYLETHRMATAEPLVASAPSPESRD